MCNQYYFYVVDADFGPLFIKFSSYFPYTARVCLNGHEYAKRQLEKAGIASTPGIAFGEAGEGHNITHQQKKLHEDELREFHNRSAIPIADDDLAETISADHTPWMPIGWPMVPPPNCSTTSSPNFDFKAAAKSWRNSTASMIPSRSARRSGQRLLMFSKPNRRE